MNFCIVPITFFYHTFFLLLVKVTSKHAVKPESRRTEQFLQRHKLDPKIDRSNYRQDFCCCRNCVRKEPKRQEEKRKSTKIMKRRRWRKCLLTAHVWSTFVNLTYSIRCLIRILAAALCNTRTDYVGRLLIICRLITVK